MNTYLRSVLVVLQAKRVVSYLGRARPERLVDELMNELQTVETLNMTIERTQTPPYFRLSQTKRYTTPINTTDDEKLETQPGDVPLEKGTLHTKRHSTNEDLPSDRWDKRCDFLHHPLIDLTCLFVPITAPHPQSRPPPYAVSPAPPPHRTSSCWVRSGD